MVIKSATVTVVVPAAEVMAAIKPTLEQQFAALGVIKSADTADADLTVTLTFGSKE